MSRFESEALSARRPSTAMQLRAAGVTPGRIRGPHWRQVRTGLYLPDPGPPASTAQRIINAAALVPDGSALAGWAAAYVCGVDWLDGNSPTADNPEPVDVITSTKRRSHDLVRYHFTREPISLRLRHGLPVTPAVQTAVDGARWAASIEDALVFLDAMLRFGQTTAQVIRSHLAGLSSVHGLEQARAAADLMRSGVWSPRESRLRFCYQTEAGLPTPLLNVRVFDEDGILIGCPDLFDPDAALATEFDGAQHREPEQHRKDNIREEHFESVGVTVVRSDSIDLRPDLDPRAWSEPI